MSKSNAFENALLKLIYQRIPIANLADDAASSPLTNLYLTLHTADPGEAGDQSTNEVTYTGMARVTVQRSADGWTVTNNSVSPVANIDFPEKTGGADQTATHASVGTAASGGGMVIHRGALSSPIVITNGVSPRIKTGTTITED